MLTSLKRLLLLLLLLNNNNINNYYYLLLRSVVQSITNSDLSDIQWLQASLPVMSGWSWAEKSVFTGTSYISAVSSKHSLPPGRYSCWPYLVRQCLSAVVSDCASTFTTVPDVLPSKQTFWHRPGILTDLAQVKSVTASIVSGCLIST